MTAPSDPCSLIDRSYALVAEVIAGISIDQRGLPTPCTELDVAALAAHAAAAAERPAAVFAGPGIAAGELEVDETAEASALAGQVKRARDEIAVLLADESVLDREYSLPWGRYSGRSIVEMYAIELAAHAWDLAVSTGQENRLDEDLAEQLLVPAEQIVPAAIRGGEMPFEPVVEAPPDAPPSERLAAWLGRRRS